MIPVLRADIVAGLGIVDEAGEWLGVSLGPVSGDVVEVLDETGPDTVKRSVDWRTVRIGDGPPG